MEKPLVSIIMGSDSDLPVMQDAARVLDEFGIPYEITVISAHRTPERASEYARSAADRGLRVIIAGAGGAAHLAGVAAAMTILPVIGVPIKSNTMSGLDSLYSTVQMPPGVPVATVAINGAKNAGILAVQMLSIGNGDLMKKMEAHKREMNDSVMKKAAKLEEQGFEKYLKEMNP